MSKSNILFFLAGAVLGGAAVWFCAREKYARLAEDEIRSVKASFRAHAARQEKTSDEKPKEPDFTELDRMLRKEGYTDYSAAASVPPSLPVVISPEEYEENDEFVKIELIYFANDVLTDEVNEVVDNADEIIGDALEHFGEYEDDSVYVRNDSRHCCYAIRKDLRYYADALKDMPPVH